MSRDFKYMGIVNANGDSFYDISRVQSEEDFILRTGNLIDAGADIIDLGACSTRPGFEIISEEEEWSRLEPYLKLYKSHFSNTPLSIDTFRSSIIQNALNLLGFEVIINDITSGDADPFMLPFAGMNGLKYIAMHHKGDLKTMHDNYDYEDVVKDVINYFESFKEKAEMFGIEDYAIDPGFGFSKSAEDNLMLLKRIGELTVLERAILIGISRKSFIYKPMGLNPDDPEVLEETVRLQKYAVSNGVSILRVHDI